MPEFRGVIHVHSTYSKDGEVELSQLCELFRGNGYQFVCLTEHADDLRPELMAGLIDRCHELSAEDFCLIPGLEIDAREGLHMLGLGLSRYVGEGSAGEIVDAIHSQGGLAILAHPKRGAERAFTGRRSLPDGVELWNTKSDSRFAPRRYRFSMLRRLRVLRPDLCGYCSVDFHWSRQYRGASVAARADRLAQESILNALRAGEFVCRVGRTTLAPTAELSIALFLRLVLWECYARMLMNVVKWVKRAARRVGVPFPKRRLRAILLRFT